MAKNNNGDSSFKKWLAKKKLSYGDFSQKTGIKYNTIVGWSRGAKLRSISKVVLRQKYPDCPLLRD